MRFLVLLILLANPVFASEYRVIKDAERQRGIPIQISFPMGVSSCSAENQCPVAFLSSGYGVAYDKYSFISGALNKAGYLVVAIQHELPDDPSLAVTGHLYTERSENWKRGAITLKFIRAQLQSEFSGYDFNKLTLVGHSNGGDISSWLLNEGVDFAGTLITLDHRRVPLPRSGSLSILSIRGADFPADQGVLYTEQEMVMFDACIVQIANSKHNDMTDFGPDWLKASISSTLLSFISGQCHGAEKA
ncbi:alpha/beta hydrolase [Alishewanella sp. 16-MA]|uniref:Alpha/beta hydrolase n=1 Tax=Alishewanella maricola TaxID=2795740 RepID=A0ABS8C7S1_9ALTE|nr:alpha/beta hydrolase [Alishewanella maricola]MCB5228392.1 alpha/beta hydrolase [Alishewanella maricola]